ncbi:N-acyl homoserine lactonase family protein [Helicobacter suis]|uniref:N-acyl homoserine lactonase family protein n=1 Tax=Helicobacter suis TaxID=104628 RepID=UPI0013D1012E|nr:N-acyl homoserine lactonase family protein [Helicobacter suis]
MKIHVLHTGEVCVSPYLPFGGDNCSLLKASGLTTPKKDWIWLPVSCYLIEHPKATILVDTGWHRDMSPEGKYDKKAQIKSLGSWILYHANQGYVPEGQAINEQLESMGINLADLDYVLLTHLDCDHANGLRAVVQAKNILCAPEEIVCAKKNGFVRYQKKWWEGVNLKTFSWNGTEGPVQKSFDLFNDGSITMINIPGHCDGLCAVKIKNDQGNFVLLFADGGYATKSWKEMITSGIALNKAQQRKSLEWIREESMSPQCIESLATHDSEITPHVIEL